MKMEYLKNVATLRLDQQLCGGCGRCLEVCPHGVFTMDARKPAIALLDACMECGACARNCACHAIFVKNGVGCAAGLLNAQLGIDSSCCGENQACCSCEPEKK
jgi:NAD-dependent dihydropyrimidine dehydrogenase PreA subunit